MYHRRLDAIDMYSQIKLGFSKEYIAPFLQYFNAYYIYFLLDCYLFKHKCNHSMERWLLYSTHVPRTKPHESLTAVLKEQYRASRLTLMMTK